jgi:23S rRNA (cytidine1920-2'-O)/16S rRNA (cytidine1409-2'-O)-methyltransferase
MRVDTEIVRRGLCESRTEAQQLINEGKVFIDGVICTKNTKQVVETNEITLVGRRQFVSRGGEKLQGALYHVLTDSDGADAFCSTRTAIDIGASTGGFTDCLLSHGIVSVDAVDVGTLQLHEKIKNNKKVTIFENIDIREFRSSYKYDIVVADLSFISLAKVLDNIISFGKLGTVFYLLIKPQFEAGRGNTKKGIVKDKRLVDDILNIYLNLAKEKGLHDLKIFPCVITGGDGNQEYFLYGIL